MTYLSATDKRTIALLALLVAAPLLLVGCGETFLEPEPKSFFAPENTFTKKAGLQGTLNNLNVTLAREYYGSTPELATEYMYTDLAVPSESRSSRQPYDVEQEIIPTNVSQTHFHVGDYWERAYNGITYANIIISNINRVTDWTSEEERNQMLAAGYFHQAYWYYRLVHQFGDVPVYLTQIEQPRTDFVSYRREAILKQIRDHLEYAVQWLRLPGDARAGEVNRAAGYHLLTKVYLSLRQFEEAESAATTVISSPYSLMRDRFGSGRFADDPDFNVMWDLFEKENISAGANTEGILMTQDQFNVEGSPGPTERIRVFVPLFFFMNGLTVDENTSFTDSLGRGVGFLRPTPYYERKVWDDKEDDYRYDETNWFSRDDFYFNDKEWLEDNGFGDLYRKPVTEERAQQVGYRGNFDSTRTWFAFPYNKYHVPDETDETTIRGGHTDWYVFRLAGTYLLRAEARYWQGDMSGAASDVNEVRERSNADPIGSGEVTIDYIFDERARELFLEEPRNTELTRVSYILAQLGRDGYSLENMAQNNWWYDRTIEHNKYFRENLQIRGFATNTYNLVPSRVYWPVPQDEIDSNVDGTINQWRGYQGSEDNVEPKGYEQIQQLPGANAHEELESIN